MTVHWRVVTDQTRPWVLAVEGCDGSAEICPDGSERPLYTYHAFVKFDGCLTYTDYANGYEWNHKCDEGCQCCEQGIHICDIDHMIAALQELKKTAQEYFKGDPAAKEWQAT